MNFLVLFYNKDNHEIANHIIAICCYAFILLNVAEFTRQDDVKTTGDEKSSMSMDYDNYRQKFYLKPEEKFKMFKVYYSFDSIWKIIDDPRYSNLGVISKIKGMWNSNVTRKIIEKKPRVRTKNATTTTPSPFGNESLTTEVYETTTRMRLPGRQNPFVLVEGTQTRVRRNLTKSLMRHTTFLYVRTFRKYPFKYGDKFDRIDLLRLRRAFVSLQFYITGRDVHGLLNNRPVIMSGFWMRHAAEYIARKYTDELPPVGSDCYKWPADLTRPDIIYFIHTPRPDNVKPESAKRIERILEVYRRMDPPVIILDQSYNEPTPKLVAKLRKEMFLTLGKTYPYVNDYMKYKPPSATKRPRPKRNRRKKLGNETATETTTENTTDSD